MADKIIIQQPVNVELFASLIKVIGAYSKKHGKDVQFNPQGKEIVILVGEVEETTFTGLSGEDLELYRKTYGVAEQTV